jgi:hypothetical protein
MMTVCAVTVARSWISFTTGGDVSMTQTQTPERYKESRDVWLDSYDRQKFEHDLINRKTSWSLTGQSILFAAYGLTLSSDSVDKSNDFHRVVALAGFLIAVLTLIDVVALVHSKRMSWRQYRDFYRTHKLPLPKPLDEKEHQWGVNTKNTWFTLTLDMGLPVIFAGAWLFLFLTLMTKP